MCACDCCWLKLSCVSLCALVGKYGLSSCTRTGLKFVRHKRNFEKLAISGQISSHWISVAPLPPTSFYAIINKIILSVPPSAHTPVCTITAEPWLRCCWFCGGNQTWNWKCRCRVYGFRRLKLQSYGLEGIFRSTFIETILTDIVLCFHLFAFTEFRLEKSNRKYNDTRRLKSEHILIHLYFDGNKGWKFYQKLIQL